MLLEAAQLVVISTGVFVLWALASYLWTHRKE